MFGIVVWCDVGEKSALIWCDDQNELALWEQSKCADADMPVAVNDCVVVKLKGSDGLRRVASVLENWGPMPKAEQTRSLGELLVEGSKVRQMPLLAS